MLLSLFFALIIPNSLAIQNNNEVCSILSICNNIAVLRSQVAAVHKEQERQANILEGSAPSLRSAEGAKELITNNNEELCSILSICNNLAALSSELAAVQAEQERQADHLEESFKIETDSFPANCYEALKNYQLSAVTEIRVPEYSENPFKVACEQEKYGGGWTIILRRTDGSEDFYREWKDYEVGFGRVDGEYFVGLAKLHALSSTVDQELLVFVRDEAGERYARYDHFMVGGKSNNYTLESLGDFSGTAGDGLRYHLGMQFSTKDRDNDIIESRHCAIEFTGAWWYRSCFDSNLAGLYSDRAFGGSIRWYTSSYIESLKIAIMMIRPRVADPQGVTNGTLPNDSK